MKRLGVVKDITYRGTLLAIGESPPDSGVEVLDSRRRRVGKVVRVFGPVEKPFISIEPTLKGKSLLGLVGTELFTE